MKSRIKLGGFTLIELMVAIFIGSMVLAAIISLFVTMIKADNDNLKAIRLNQELRAAMSLITRDIRRAGANQNAVELYSTSPPTPPTNPFAVISLPINSSANNITFSYDADGNKNTIELYGYRLNTTLGRERIETCSSTCATSWEPVTDESFDIITQLDFADTTLIQSGVNIREITVTITGQLRRDTTVIRTLTETIKVRNDQI